MSKMKTVYPLLLALALTIGFALPLFADDDSDTDAPAIVGSWDVVTELSTGETSPSVFAFHADGVFTSSGIGTASGSWKQIGERTFAASNVGYFFDAAGNVTLRFESDSVETVSEDGNSFEAVFEGEFRAPDGTLVQSVSGTSTGTRIEVSH